MTSNKRVAVILVYETLMRIDRHLGGAKKQLEDSLGMFATLRRKLSQMNGKFAFVLRVAANVSVS